MAGQRHACPGQYHQRHLQPDARRGNASGTFAGVIHGNNTTFATDGAMEAGYLTLTKIGSGTQILAGPNTYTGVTTISNGTLQLGTGQSGQDGSLASTSIINNSTLAFNLAGSQTAGSIISGSGGLAKLGTGTLVIGANNTYSGPTVITGGMVQLMPDAFKYYSFTPTQMNSGTSIQMSELAFYNTSGTRVLAGSARPLPKLSHRSLATVRCGQHQRQQSHHEVRDQHRSEPGDHFILLLGPDLQHLQLGHR